MKFIFCFSVLFLFFKSIKSLNLSCDGCSKAVLNAINNLVFTLDVEPQSIKILFEGSFETPKQFIRLNITKVNGQYSCNDTFNGYNLKINQPYLIVVGYQNQDHNTNVYMKFHNYMPKKIEPEQILNSIKNYFYVYLENTYLINDLLNFNIKLISLDNSYSFNAEDCEYNRNLNYIQCILNINKIGTYYLKVDDIKFNNITLEILDKSLEVLDVTPHMDININENNFYLELNVDPKLYSSLGHSFEFIIATDSTEKRKIILSNCVKFDLTHLYCNKISDFFKPLSVYYFYYNQIKLDAPNIQTKELKYPDFKSIEAYDNYYINEGQSNIKKIYINVDDTDSIDISNFYLIDENNSKTNLNNCNNINTNQILCECNIYNSGEYYINYYNYTIAYSINFINIDNGTTIIDSVGLETISPNTIQLNSSNEIINFYLYFNNVNYENYINNISIYNNNNSIFKNLNCSSSSYYDALYCYFYANSSYLGYNYIYINNKDTGKYINIYQNNSYSSSSLITKVYPSQVRFGDINIELTFNVNANQYKNNITIGGYKADCYYYSSRPYILECDLYISRIGEYAIYVNNVNTGKILNVNTITIDDSSSSISYVKLNIFYLVFIFIFFLFNF